MSCGNADFLHGLSALQALKLHFSTSALVAVDIPRTCAALQSCMGLCELLLANLSCTSKQLASALQRMPLLHTLELGQMLLLDSLSFLSAGTLASTLTSFSLGNTAGQLPLRELHKVHALRHLQHLSLHYHSFDEELHPWMLELYQPWPSGCHILPQLQTFDFQYPPDEHDHQ